MKKLITFLLAFTFLITNVAYADEPTIQDVYETAVSGDMDKANLMMEDVLLKHPNSAKAHYAYAQLLAKQDKIDLSKSELERAESIDSKLSFAEEEAVIELKNHLNSFKQQDLINK